MTTTSYQGSDLSGTTGSTGRILTHTSTVPAYTIIIIGRRILHLNIEYSLSGSTVTFFNQIDNTDRINIYVPIDIGTPNFSQFLGSNLTGSDGATGRTLTHTEALNTGAMVIVGGFILNPAQMSISGSSVVFNVPIDNTDNILVWNPVSGGMTRTSILGSALLGTTGTQNRTYQTSNTPTQNLFITVGGSVLMYGYDYSFTANLITFILHMDNTDVITIYDGTAGAVIIPPTPTDPTTANTLYCSADDVSALLQLVVPFSSTTMPTMNEVVDIIRRKMDVIDKFTGHAWREVTVEEEYLDPLNGYEYGTGIPFSLRHRKVRTLDNAEESLNSDSIQVWTGSQWEELVATGTENRYGGKYWMDYTNGTLFLLQHRSIYPRGVKMKYRYGDVYVPYWVQDICAKMVAMDVLSMYEKVLMFNDDGASNKLNHQTKIQIWERQVETIIQSQKEFIVL